MAILWKKFTDEYYEARYSVEEHEDYMRLDQFMQTFMASFSRQQIKKKIEQKEIQILGRPGKQKPNTKVHFQEQVMLKIYKTTQEDEYWHGEKLELETTPKIIYEDDGLLAVYKPPYMATHPTGKHLFNCATVFFENKYEKTIHSIHRLDRETSGVLLLAKNPTCANIVTELFEKDLVRKCYFFIAKDNGTAMEFQAKERLGTNEKGLKRVYINHYPHDSQDGKHAFTHFKILHKENGYCIGLAFPQTGRQHQIRVHAMINNYPLIGDKLYLGNFKMFQRFKDLLASEEDYNLMELSRHALHALAINFPYQGKRQTFISPLPCDLKDWIMNKMTIKITELETLLSAEGQAYFNSLDK